MSANIIDGKAVALNIKDILKEKINKLPFTIKLAVAKVGDDPASAVYVKNKIKACEYVGIQSVSYQFDYQITQKELEIEINKLILDDSIDGILVQLPLPKHINEQEIIDLIPLEKDVDGFSDINLGKLAAQKQCTVACTPFGVMKLIESTNVDLMGKNAVVVGRSNNVGKPIAMLLLNANCTVTICHSKTKNLTDFTKNADILVCAVGRPNTITGDMVKHGAIVIDVGINRTESGLVGDVDFNSVKEVASYITPVPGGVGPMTVTMLMQNTYELALRRRSE